ncbi:MAG: 16S rRNA (uracil(1498)-N(3))-methyltransferase [Thermomicrobium sp.]|nr:16S rRNA (uracil(1498)-N(3))-methyltransferase [Thermomicrobium sp.]
MSRRGHRFFLPQPLRSGERIELPERIRHQVTRVLRLGPGDELVLFDGRGVDWIATLETVRPTLVTARIETERPARPLPVPPVTLCLALLRHDHFDLVVEKATELGIVRLVPIRSRRVVVHLDEDGIRHRLARWERIAIEASEQCGRGVLPVIERPRTLAEALDLVPHHRQIVFWEAPGLPSLAADSLAPDRPLALFVGPEGGWSDDEIAFFRDSGAAFRSLGPLVLRAETAAIAGIAAVQARVAQDSALTWSTVPDAPRASAGD